MADDESSFVLLDLISPHDPIAVPAELSSVDAVGAELIGAARVPADVDADSLTLSALRDLVSSNLTSGLGSASEEVSIVVQLDRLAPRAELRAIEVQVGQGDPARWTTTVLNLAWVGSECSLRCGRSFTRSPCANG